MQNRKVFAVVNNSPFAFVSYRYLQGAGVPLIGGGSDGTYYGAKGNENIISALGNTAPVTGLTYDYGTNLAKKLGATKIGSVAFGVAPSSTAAAQAVQQYAAPASGLEPVYLNTSVDFATTDVGPVVLGHQERRGRRRVPAPRRQHGPPHRAGPPAERRAHEGRPDGVGLRAGHAQLAHR